jgi:glycosyltransferase involved in cell wall biosynthesis
MRILLLNYEFPPMGGGAGRATYNIAKQLARLGHEVDVLTSKAKGQKAYEVSDGVAHHRVQVFRKGVHECGFCGAFVYVLFAYFKLRHMINRHDYDILHFFFSLPTGLLAILPGKHRHIPYILSLRGSDVPFYDPFNSRLAIMHRLLKPVTLKIWRGAKLVVALSQSLRLTAMRTSLKEKIDIDIIRNGIDGDLFCPGKNKAVEQSFKMIAVSRLIERKGIQHVLTAMAELADAEIRLTIVGSGNYEKHLRQMCKEYGLESAVKFLGYCPNEQLPALYHANDVFILTSLAESFGIVFLEAMASGLPVIGARTGGIPAIVSHENGILVEPGAVAEIKKAIVKMKNSPDLRNSMALENRRKVLGQYSWQSVAEMYQLIYQKHCLKVPNYSQPLVNWSKDVSLAYRHR